LGHGRRILLAASREQHVLVGEKRPGRGVGPGSLPELVSDAGLVVEPTADAVQAALGDPGLAGELRTAARARGLAFPWSRTVAGWLGALERATGRA
jgi:hypothetical protein